ncbi:MAG: ATP-binding protein, partial [Oscillospiraceae bacterium]
LSLAIAKEVIAKGYGVLYTSVQGMVNKLEKERFRKGYDNNEENFDYLEMLEQSDLLILDDLGIEFSTSFSGAIINDILNNRLVKGLPTIISTNLDGTGIRERYSSRLVSRLLGSYKTFMFIGKDIRVIKKMGG